MEEGVITMTTHFPYIIVGGGPAGATAAELLGRAKKRTLLIEKSQYNPYREKPCGGGLGPITIKLFPFTRTLGIHKTSKLIISMGDESLEYDVPIVMVNRNRFDQHLIQRALECGTKVLFGRKVCDVNLDKRYIELDTKLKISYDYIIGAGGITCPVKHALGFNTKTVPLIVGKSDGGELNKADACEIIFFDDFEGYAWIFPKGKFLDVGIGGNAPVEKMRTLLDYLLKERGLKLEDKSGWHLPYEVSSIEFFSGPRTILCGDAGAFVNPATGEGIRYAMQSGLEAAQILLHTRKITNYPSFLPSLQKLQERRTKIVTQGIRQSFEEMKRSPELVEETINFFFQDRPPQKRTPLSDEEKVKALKTISNNLDK
jgi:geranylgeranyl reductase family protein